MTKDILAPVVGAATSTIYRRIAVASAIAGLIVAALVLITPNLLFERFIVMTGLPGVVEAAAPPLGVKARLVFAMIAAGGVGGIAFAVLSVALTRKGSDSSNRMSPEDEFFAFTPPAPRRRADSHPDAPPRPPINAGDDLGTPLDLVDVVSDDEWGADAVEPEATSEPVWRDDFESGEDEILDLPTAPDSDAEPAAEVDEPEGASVDEPWDHVPSVPSPSLSEEDSFGREFRESAEAQPSDVQPEAAPEEPATEHPANAAHGELMDLVTRLEAGIERRRHRAGRAANDAEATTVTPHPATRSGRDDELQGALRDALDALQKLDARG